MKISGKPELLRMLDEMGSTSIKSLLYRITDLFDPDLFRDLKDLIKNGDIEIDGNAMAVENFIYAAENLSKDKNLSPVEFRQRIYKEMKNHPDLEKATITLTKKAFMNLCKY